MCALDVGESNMRNARDEFIRLSEEANYRVLAARVAAATLYPGHTEAEYTEFLAKLDFEYDAGFGCQELFGTVWFTDGTWAERYEYDGCESWTHMVCPKPPYKI